MQAILLHLHDHNIISSKERWHFIEQQEEPLRVVISRPRQPGAALIMTLAAE